MCGIIRIFPAESGSPWIPPEPTDAVREGGTAQARQHGAAAQADCTGRQSD